MTALTSHAPWGATPGLALRPWTPAEMSTLRDAFDAGIETDEQIGARLNRSARAVAIKRHKLGLTIRDLPKGRSARDLADDTLVRELRSRGYTVTAPACAEVGS
jgi:hypothetical protein